MSLSAQSPPPLCFLPVLTHHRTFRPPPRIDNRAPLLSLPLQFFPSRTLFFVFFTYSPFSVPDEKTPPSRRCLSVFSSCKPPVFHFFALHTPLREGLKFPVLWVNFFPWRPPPHFFSSCQIIPSLRFLLSFLKFSRFIVLRYPGAS